MSAVRRSVEDKGDDKGHSGRLLLRMPRPLHAELARQAEQNGTSLNQLIVSLLSGALADGSGSSEAPQSRNGDTASAATTERRLGIALTVNLVVLVVAAVLAIALLIGAWIGF